MRNRIHTIGLLGLLLGALHAAPVQATAYTFSGTGTWRTAANWAPSVPPDTLGNGNTFTINAGATCTITSGTSTALSVHLSGQGTNNGTIVIAASQRFYVEGAYGTLANNGTINVQVGGYLQNSKSMSNAAAGVIVVSGQVSLGDYGSNFDNNGKITINAGASGGFTGSASGGGGVFNNNSGGRIDNYSNNVATGTTGNFNNKAGATIIHYTGSKWTSYCATSNAGTYTLNSGSSMGMVNWFFKNETGGVFHIGGALNISAAAQLQNYGTVNATANIENTGSISNAAGATWNGTGTYLGGPFYNYGRISPGGTAVKMITINFANQTCLDMRETAVLDCDVAGAAGGGAASGNDLIAVTGYVKYTTGAKINVRFINGFVPAVGNVFKIITKYGGSGTPALVLPAGYTAQVLDTPYDTSIKILTKP